MLDRGYVNAASVVHDLSARSKILATVGFVLIVVATPREWVLAFAGYAVIVLLAAAVAHIPPRRLLAGMVIEVPFVAFAVLLPLIHPGPEGMWAAWNIAVKATLGVLAATVLASTTTGVELVAGLQALRLPSAVVAICSFFVRYLDVVAEQFSRMRTAQQARGMSLGSVRSWPAMSAGLGSLFVRSYERGERVHLALLSRGYDGRLPGVESTGGREWPAAVVPAAAAAVLLLTAVIHR